MLKASLTRYLFPCSASWQIIVFPRKFVSILRWEQIWSPQCSWGRQSAIVTPVSCYYFQGHNVYTLSYHRVCAGWSRICSKEKEELIHSSRFDCMQICVCRNGSKDSLHWTFFPTSEISFWSFWFSRHTRRVVRKVFWDCTCYIFEKDHHQHLGVLSEDGMTQS